MDQLAPYQPNRGFTVQIPHPADGIGLALAHAFRNDKALPSDFQRALDAIDRRSCN